ncbi:hypothetical protein [Ideonella sp.]|uniref:hypothetical protein n=1 Tax=Ideonella sp. TaxID=1929293 RepID=UPI0035B29FA9
MAARGLVVAALVSVAAAAVCAAPPARVEALADGDWSRLHAAVAAPAVVVFTTTDCAHCPAAIARLGAAVRQRGAGARLWVVVMDVPPGQDDAALLADAHHAPADRLFAFAGEPARLRHQVNPAWRGVTPYVAWLAPAQAPRFVTGAPPEAEVRAWAAGR